ncbi:hypothetical protein Tco_1281029 [Tanacetum coccineum]
MNENKGIMPTNIELTLEQSQQGVSDNVLVAEDREFGIRVNRLRGEMIVVYEDKVSFVEELETLSGVIATAKTAVFLKETMDNDDGRVLLLHDLEKQAEERALEKELFVHKLIHDVSC